MIIFFPLIISTLSCQKNNSNSSEVKTLVGKWNKVSHTEKENGVIVGTPSIGRPGDYFDFKVNNILEVGSNSR